MKRQSGNQGIGKSGNSPLLKPACARTHADRGVRGLLSLATRSSLLATLIIGVICVICGSLFADTQTNFTFTENFSTTTYKDAANTTANWDTVSGTSKLPKDAYGPSQIPFGKPAGLSGPYTSAWSFGPQFRPLKDGRIVGLWRYSGNADNKKVKLWDDVGNLLGSVTVPAAAGWQYAAFGTPVNVTAGTLYRLNVAWEGNSWWLYNIGAPAPRAFGDIEIDYCYGAPGSSDPGFPNSGYSNVYMGGPCDIEFQPGPQYGTATKVVQSLAVASPVATIAAVNLMVSATLPANTSITYEVSANAGVNWYQIIPNQGLGIPPAGRGNDLRWRANLSTTDGAVTPSLNVITLTYYTGTTIVSSTNWTSLIPAGGKVTMGDTIAQVSFSMAVSGTNTAHWKRFRVDKYARAGQALIPDDKIVVQVWMENNGDGFFDIGDQMIAQGTFTNNTCYLNLTRRVIDATPHTYYIVYKFAPDCGGGQFAGVNIGDSSWLEFEDAVCIGVPP